MDDDEEDDVEDDVDGGPVGEQVDGSAFVDAVAAELGVDAPGEQDVEDLLAVASAAAHASERWAAPVTCALVAAAGLDPAEARTLVDRVALRYGHAEG